MSDYLNVEYDILSHPKNEYPDKLAYYLFERFGMRSGKKILEPGCGRGEFLNGFRKLGMKCFGADISPEAGTMLEGVPVIKTDLEKDPLPFENDTFDYIYNKSFLEHLWYPEFSNQVAVLLVLFQTGRVTTKPILTTIRTGLHLQYYH